MFVLESYPLAVVFCVITMFCWGSWANTQKLAKKGWRFELFYWDYTIGVLLLTLILGLSLGSHGSVGRPFLEDFGHVSHASVHSALLGGAIFNLANILLVAAIELRPVPCALHGDSTVRILATKSQRGLRPQRKPNKMKSHRCTQMHTDEQQQPR